MKEFGELDKLLEIREPHDWSKQSRPRRVTVEHPIDLLKELAGTKKVIESLGV